MRAIVTGATGFVGRHLCAHLVATGWTVVAIHRDSSSSQRVNELEAAGAETRSFSEFEDLEEIVKSARADAVFHLAAYFVRSPVQRDIATFIDANVTFGTYLLEALVGSQARVVNVASYFQFRGGEPDPNSLYAASKQAFLEIARFYRDVRSLDIRTVVLNDNYGPDDDRDKLVNQLVAAGRSRGAIALGNSDQRINLIHIRDLVAGLAAASAPNEPSMMSIRADDDTSVGAIVTLVADAVGNQLDSTFDNDRAIDTRVSDPGAWPSPSGWHPRVSLDAGLRELLN